MLTFSSFMFSRRSILVLFHLLLLYPAWIRGGTHVTAQFPMVWIAALLLLQVTVYLFRKPELRRDFFRDPVVYLGAIFLSLLLAQWWNAGRELILDWESMKWVYEAPRCDGLPSAIRREDAAEMLRWFFPAFVLIATVRHAVRTPGTVKRILDIMCISASVLASLCACQWLLARLWGIGQVPSESYCFTSFGYANHVGIYFVFILCLSLGLLVDAAFSKGAQRKHIIMRSVTTLSVFVGATLSASRAALVLACTVLVAASLYFMWRSWNRCSRVALVNRASGVLAMLLLVLFVVHGAGQGYLQEEFGSLFDSRSELVRRSGAGSAGKSSIEEGLFGVRVLQREVALDIWHDHAWFGAGGWSYGHMAATYLEEDQWRDIVGSGSGRANAHNDPLQFLSEFGVVGSGLMLLSVFFLLQPLFKKRHRCLGSPVSIFSIVGVTIVWCYSWVDLPFRSPAVLYAWGIVLAGVPATLQKAQEQLK